MTESRPAAVRVAGRRIGPGEPVFVICEAGVTNYGELELARRQIDAAAEAGADAIKFQLWQTERLVSKAVARRLQPQLGYDWFDRLKSKELSREDLRLLQAHARARGLMFFATPHDEPSLEFLDAGLDVPVLKVGSGEAHNHAFLQAVAARRKPVIISFGFHGDAEVAAAVEVLTRGGAAGVVVLHCVTAYPTPYELAHLSRIGELERLTGRPAGYSDHTVGYHALLGAVALGACALEKHLTFDKADPRSLDNPGALLPGEFASLVREVRELERALAPPDARARLAAASSAREWAGQSIVAAADLPAGVVLERAMLLLKRPAAGGLGPEQLERVIGRRTRRAVGADEQLQLEDLDA